MMGHSCFALSKSWNVSASIKRENVSRQSFLESQNQMPLEILKLKPRRVKHFIFGNRFRMPLSQCE